MSGILTFRRSTRASLGCPARDARDGAVFIDPIFTSFVARSWAAPDAYRTLRQEWKLWELIPRSLVKGSFFLEKLQVAQRPTDLEASGATLATVGTVNAARCESWRRAGCRCCRPKGLQAGRGWSAFVAVGPGGTGVQRKKVEMELGLAINFMGFNGGITNAIKL